MYDDLESLGASPDEVEKSLLELGVNTLRLHRTTAHRWIEDGMDKAEEGVERHNRWIEDDEELAESEREYKYRPPTLTERQIMVNAIVQNNCVLYGSFHYATKNGQILGCPLTLAFNITDGEDHTSIAETTEDSGWTEYFYNDWDTRASVYIADHRNDIERTEYSADFDNTAFVLVD